MITNIDLERICNYEDNPKATQPSISINYLDYIIEDDEIKKLKQKRHNRDLAIDAILDGKIDEYIENKDKILKDDYQNIGIDINTGKTYATISAKIISISLKCNKLIDLNTLYNDIILYLNNITNYNMNYAPQCLNMQLVYDSNKTLDENENENKRKLISRIMNCSNLIGINGRIGLGKTVLIGDDLVKYFNNSKYNCQKKDNGLLGTISGLDIIHTHLINPKKVIVIRGSNKPANGLNVITNINNGLYYMDRTSGWEKTMAWFEVL